MFFHTAFGKEMIYEQDVIMDDWTDLPGIHDDELSI